MGRRQLVTIEDLTDQTGTAGPHPILYCDACGERNSANKSDYFMTPAKHVFKHCGVPMRLVYKRTTFVDAW